MWLRGVQTCNDRWWQHNRVSVLCAKPTYKTAATTNVVILQPRASKPFENTPFALLDRTRYTLRVGTGNPLV